MYNILLYLLLFFLPTQLGKHFWFDFSYKLGQRVDYLSPTFYFTDIITFLIIIIYFFRNKKNFFNGKLIKWLIGLMVFIGYWLLIEKENPYLLAYNLFKLIEMVLLGVIVAKTLSKRDFPQVVKVLNLSLIIQLALALYQVIVEKSAGLWIIGERSFSIQTPGIAKFVAVGGYQLLRGYGTFPHSNLLAGFSLVLLGCNLGMLRWKSRLKTWWIAGLTFSLLGIILSFSLLAWGIALLMIIFTLRKFYLYPLLITIYWLLITFLKSDSVTRRVDLLNISWNLFKTSPLLGIGLGNFIPKMPALPGQVYFWQPVHNIFVLIAVETGLVGLAIIVSLLYCFIAKFKKLLITNYLLLIPIVVTGFFDHYWLTLQQGRLLLAFIIGLAFIKTSSKRS